MPAEVGPVLLPVLVSITWLTVIAQVETMPQVICAR